MKFYKIFAFLVLVALTGCQENESPLIERKEEGVVVEMDFIWKIPLTDKRWVNSGGIQSSVYSNYYLTATHFETYPKLVAIDVISGEIQWEWRDFIGLDAINEYISVTWPYQKDNYYIFHKGNRGYCIDLERGETVWKKEDMIGNTHSYINGYEDKLIKTIHDVEIDDWFYSFDYIFDLNNEVYKIIPFQPIVGRPSAANQYAIGSHGGSLFESGGKDYLVHISGQVDSNWNAFAYLGLYDMSDEEWVYYGKQVIPEGRSRVADGFPIIEDDIVVNSIGHFICANNLWTGDSLWAIECRGNFVFGGFFVDSGFVYALSEGDALYCFDLYTGDQCWKMDKEGLGTSSQMVHYDDVIYFTSGGNGNLMAVDMNTGELLWNIESPDSEPFNREIAIWQGDEDHSARVLTATYQSVLAYDVIQR